MVDRNLARRGIGVNDFAAQMVDLETRVRRRLLLDGRRRMTSGKKEKNNGYARK